jgi:hypothetical protein
MPIDLGINHLDRMVTAVAHGNITRDEVEGFARELFEVGLFHYKKLVDISAAISQLTSEDLAVFAARFRDRPKTIRSGPVAIVVDAKRGEMGRLIVELTRKDRPTRIFHNIHEARKWLNENA